MARLTEPHTVTDSRYSAFLQIEEGVIVPVREEISAILLVCIWKRNGEIVGSSHPKPRVEFDYLPSVLVSTAAVAATWNRTKNRIAHWEPARSLPHTATSP